jgi:signal transduction histidine kinase
MAPAELDSRELGTRIAPSRSPARRAAEAQGDPMEKPDLKPLLGHLCSAVGHQVINSLSTIVSQGEVLRTLSNRGELGSNEASERIETMVRTALEASTITRRLIDLSHDLTSINQARPLWPTEQIDLVPLVSELVAAEKDTLGPAASWTLELVPLPRIHGQAEPLRIMLRQLLQNAVESLPGGAGSISIASLTGVRNWVILEIRDQGSGMTPTVLEHAVEPFFTTKPDRLGLGLTIARGIWRRHHGTVTLESQPGEGTTIRLSAPPIGGS